MQKHGNFNLGDTSTSSRVLLTETDKQRLEEQNKRMVSQFQAEKLEAEARKHWDLFYKRNQTKFFKDRHWTTREFSELLADPQPSGLSDAKILLEIGCGVGNLVFPLIEDGNQNYFIYACDLSPRAIDLVRAHNLYNDQQINAFCCDITTEAIFDTIPEDTVDIITLVFVLSAIHPEKFPTVIRNLYRLMKPGGVVLFRDYGLYDMAQLRFKAGHKIAENFYMRQDGTRSYYFSAEEISNLFSQAGFDIVNNNYIHRRTVNVKEDINVPRIFVQGKFRKPD